MKLSTLGIGLLTVMVAINCYLNEGYFTKQDGSFKNGIIIDRSNIIASLNDLRTAKNDAELYAFSSVSAVNLTNWVDYVESPISIRDTEQIETIQKLEEPISAEQGNSLVIYNQNNPEKNLIAAKFEDFVDDIPLDNTNTIVSGFMQLMPRK